MSDPRFTVVVKVSGSILRGEVPVFIGCADTALAFQIWCIQTGYRAVAEDVLLHHLPARTQYEEEVASALARAFSTSGAH